MPDTLDKLVSNGYAYARADDRVIISKSDDNSASYLQVCVYMSGDAKVMKAQGDPVLITRWLKYLGYLFKG